MSQRPGSTDMPSVEITSAPAGTASVPTCPTAVIRSPSTSITELRIGGRRTRRSACRRRARPRGPRRPPWPGLIDATRRHRRGENDDEPDAGKSSADHGEPSSGGDDPTAGTKACGGVNRVESPREEPTMVTRRAALTALLIVAVLFGVPTSVLRAVPAAPQQQGRAAAPATIEDRTNGLRKIDGYVPLYWDERAATMLPEISRFDSEFLFSTGLSAGLGSRLAQQRHGREVASRPLQTMGYKGPLRGRTDQLAQLRAAKQADDKAILDLKEQLAKSQAEKASVERAMAEAKKSAAQ